MEIISCKNFHGAQSGRDYKAGQHYVVDNDVGQYLINIGYAEPAGGGYFSPAVMFGEPQAQENERGNDNEHAEKPTNKARRDSRSDN